MYVRGMVLLLFCTIAVGRVLRHTAISKGGASGAVEIRKPGHTLSTFSVVRAGAEHWQSLITNAQPLKHGLQV